MIQSLNKEKIVKHNNLLQVITIFYLGVLNLIQ